MARTKIKPIMVGTKRFSAIIPPNRKDEGLPGRVLRYFAKRRTLGLPIRGEQLCHAVTVRRAV